MLPDGHKQNRHWTKLPMNIHIAVWCSHNLQICIGSLTMTVLFPNICDLNTIPCFSCLQHRENHCSKRAISDDNNKELIWSKLHRYLSAKNPDRSFSQSRLSPSKGKPKDPLGS